MIKTSPAVFAVGDRYQIMVEVQSPSLMSVRVGQQTYYDETNGIMNSLSPIHRVQVPMEVLDEAKTYTLCIRPLVERKPYFSTTEDMVEFSYEFHPVPAENIRAYHISDAHNRIDEPVKAAQTFGRIDLLILNGDVINHSGSPEKFSNIYEICAALTGGCVPVVFSRGNHDMRGNFAEKFADYTPNRQGNTYYTFKVGSIWGMLLDCGEDKPDDHPEYGFTVACHGFRERQTAYIRSVIENAEKEYAHPDVKTKLVIAHAPFTRRYDPPFDIETDIYRQWTALLGEYIRPDLILSGHTHRHGIDHVGGEHDHLGQPCTVVIASEPREDRFIGCGFVFEDAQIRAEFTDSLGNTLSKTIIPK